MEKKKEVSKYSILSSLSLIVGFSLNIIFENPIFPIVGLIVSAFFFVKQLRAL